MKAYKEKWSQLAEDLVNTYDTYLEDPEHLKTPQDLRQFLAKHSFPAPGVQMEELHAIYKLREELRIVFSTTNASEAAQYLNTLLASTPLTSQMVRTRDGQWRIEYTPIAGGTIIQRVQAAAALGLSFAFEHYGKERLRVCAAEPCRDVFIDTSRNRSRRYCSDRCANRYNIALYRTRQQTEQEV